MPNLRLLTEHHAFEQLIRLNHALRICPTMLCADDYTLQAEPINQYSFCQYGVGPYLSSSLTLLDGSIVVVNEQSVQMKIKHTHSACTSSLAFRLFVFISRTAIDIAINGFSCRLFPLKSLPTPTRQSQAIVYAQIVANHFASREAKGYTACVLVFRTNGDTGPRGTGVKKDASQQQNKISHQRVSLMQL